ncbi:MAG: cobalamin biosynthesis protein, partial [Acidobacteriota bacterium]
TKPFDNDELVKVVRRAIGLAGVGLAEVGCLASADLKRNEAGLIEAARVLGVPFRVIPSDDLRRCRREFTQSKFVQKKVNLPAVAEPAALLAGRRTEFLLRRQVIDGITVAVARENSMPSA